MIEQQQEYYFSRKIGKEYLIYSSDQYKLSELEILNLIKICILEGRSRIIGRKILAVYRDVNNNNIEQVEKKLFSMGIKVNEKPTREKKPNTK